MTTVSYLVEILPLVTLQVNTMLAVGFLEVCYYYNTIHLRLYEEPSTYMYETINRCEDSVYMYRFNWSSYY